MQRLLTIIAGVGGIYYLVVASRLLTFFGIFIPPQQHRAISLSLALILIFLLGSTHLASAKKRTVQWYDVALLVAGLLGTGFVALFQEQVMEYEDYAFLDLKGTVLAFLLAIVLLEAVRRATNIVLPLLIAFFLLAASFQNYLPGLLRGPDVSVDRLTYTFYTGSAGVFGIPLGIASGILVIFLIFGRLLQQAGGGKWFLDLALAITGRVSGGPAKAAVTASFFFGMISGSPSANTATTGAITIPLMKSTGYKSTFAGAVEAVSSTGGQIMPPVMGAIAFIMAEWLGIDYVQVVIAAFVPAIIYFLIVFASVHFETKRQAMPMVPRAQIPPLIPTIVRGWFYLPPLVTLVYVLIVMRYPPDMAGLAAISVLIGFSMFSKEKEQRLYPKRLFDGLALGIKGWLTVASVTAAVGMLIGAMELTGLGVKFSSFMLDISGGNLLLTLALVGVASFILGMGLDSIPAYIMLVILTAPALIKLGVPDIAAHLFVIYWGLASFFTPPVCMAVYVACGISEGGVWRTGWQAVRLGIAAFLVPISFALHPGLLLMGTGAEIALSIVTALVGGILLAGGLRGYFFKTANWPQRIIMLVGGILLVLPGTLNSLLGASALVVALSWQWLEARAGAKATTSLSKE